MEPNSDDNKVIIVVAISAQPISLSLISSEIRTSTSQYWSICV